MIDVPPKQAAKAYHDYHNLGILNGPKEGDKSFSHEILRDCDGSLEAFLAELFAVFADEERVSPWQKTFDGKTYDPSILLQVASDPTSTLVEDYSIRESKGYDHLRVEFDTIGAHQKIFGLLEEAQASDAPEERLKELMGEFQEDVENARRGNMSMLSVRQINQITIAKIARGMAKDGMPPPYFSEEPQVDPLHSEDAS